MANFGFRILVSIFFSSCLLFDYSSGLECKGARKSLLGILKNYCPSPFDDDDKSYCCEAPDGSIYCCDFDEFAKSKGAQFLIPVVIGVVIGILAGCFLCCLCCPCCMLYKRRHQGTVYGRVQQPAIVTNVPAPNPNSGFVPSPAPMPMPMPQPSGGFATQQPSVPYPQYPAPTVDYTGQFQAPPPPYSAAVGNDGYVKQAPYNPNYYGN